MSYDLIKENVLKKTTAALRLGNTLATAVRQLEEEEINYRTDIVAVSVHDDLAVLSLDFRVLSGHDPALVFEEAEQTSMDLVNIGWLSSRRDREYDKYYITRWQLTHVDYPGIEIVVEYTWWHYGRQDITVLDKALGIVRFEAPVEQLNAA